MESTIIDPRMTARLIGQRMFDKRMILRYSPRLAALACGIPTWRYNLIEDGTTHNLKTTDKELQQIALGLRLNLKYLCWGEEQEGKDK